MSLKVSTKSQSILDEGQKLIDRVAVIEASFQQPDLFTPSEIIQELINDMTSFVNKTVANDNPQTLEEFYVCELKRIISKHVQGMILEISSDAPNFDKIMDILGIVQADFDSIESWLESHHEKAKIANQKLVLAIDPDDHRARTDLGLAPIREKAEDLIKVKIESLKKLLIDNLKNDENVKNFFKTYSVSGNTLNSRSYINDTAMTVSIGIADTTYVSNGIVKIQPVNFLSSYSHEVFGHGLHFATTAQDKELPKFLKTKLGTSLAATIEGVSQFFEREFFTILLENPSISNELGFEQPFSEIYNEYVQRELLIDYSKNYSIYATKVLGFAGKPKTQEDFEKLMEALSKYSLNPMEPTNIINGSQNSWDQRTGRLLWKYASEIRYASQVVSRIMAGIAPEKQTQAKNLILRGFYTPQGLEDWVRINLKDN